MNVKVQTERLLEEEIQLEVTVTSPDAHISTQSVQVAMDEENFLFSIEEPKLWWPKGYGDQPLYGIKITAKAAGEILDQKPSKLVYGQLRSNMKQINGENLLSLL